MLEDVDHIKLVNDQCGPVAGDPALVYITQIATTLTFDVQPDVRQGNDEFCESYGSITEQQAWQMAEIVCEAIYQAAHSHSQGIALLGSYLALPPEV
ncbi:GGDEF domain-containing protein [Salinimonas lutimaris]|uniref:GGDEF domain-containing protein n=1 Tax=Salinimonas lutimaris TaxID=914153 RepID=UPI001E33C40A|nr:GGDEF domain-containing protein [Salinimonas lutimaris]